MVLVPGWQYEFCCCRLYAGLPRCGLLIISSHGFLPEADLIELLVIDQPYISYSFASVDNDKLS